MEKRQIRSSVIIGVLIALTCSAMAYSKIRETHHSVTHIEPGNNDAILPLSGQLPQSKIHMNGDGKVTMGITVSAENLPQAQNVHNGPVDLIIVLDRSGSMQGKNLQDAKQAIVSIVNSMGEEDRFSLLTYSDHVSQHTPLLQVTPANRNGIV